MHKYDVRRRTKFSILALTAVWIVCPNASSADARLTPSGVPLPIVMETAKIMPADSEAGDVFGWSVALDGETLVIGAPKDRSQPFRGSAYLFDWDDLDGWVESGKLNGDSAASSDDYGWSVDIKGDTAVVSAPYDDTNGIESGRVYIYDRNEGGDDSWGEVQRLEPSDAEPRDKFGYEVALDGDTLVVGAYLADAACILACLDAGAAYVFERDAGGTNAWGEVAILQASDPSEGAFFGRAVAIEGDTIVIGAPNANKTYIFERDAGGPGLWGEAQILTSAEASKSAKLGRSLSIDGDLLLVGAHRDSVAGARSGAAYVFERDSDTTDTLWNEVARLTPPDGEPDDYFGLDVAIDGTNAFVSARYDDGACPEDPGCNSGSLYYFQRDRDGINAWGGVVKAGATDAEFRDVFGSAIAVQGTQIVVTAPEGLAMFPLGPGSAYDFHVAAPEPIALALTGACPGPLDFDISNASPDADLVVFWSRVRRPNLSPPGPCADVIVGLEDYAAVETTQSDANGLALLTLDVPEAACGSFVQIGELGTCAMSPVVDIPPVDMPTVNVPVVPSP